MTLVVVLDDDVKDVSPTGGPVLVEADKSVSCDMIVAPAIISLGVWLSYFE